MRKILLSLSFLAVTWIVGWHGDAVISGFITTAHAQQIRQLPVNGKRGKTGQALPLPQVVIGRQTLNLAPGGVIFDANNRAILHQALPVNADVWIQMNNQGQVQRIYILRPDEQARLDAARKWYEF